MDKVTIGEGACTIRRDAFVNMQGAARKTGLPPQWLTAAVLLLLLFAPPAQPQQSRPTESQVKAAYLYNFGKFVRWPEDSPSQPGEFEICVLGKDPLASVLEGTVANEQVDRKAIHVRRISSPSDAEACKILFISISEEGRLKSILAAVQTQSVLTVSEIPHFAERGGDIGFVTQEDKIRFEVNLGAAQRSHLKLSSELLKVASKVIGGTPQGGL